MVYQGEREMAAHNRLLGKFDLLGIPPAPRGIPQVEVTFDIDNNGILNVSAKDLGTGKEQQIRIQSSSGLSEDEIQRMVKDGEVHAQEDKKEREKVDTRNHAEQLVIQTEKTLGEMADKISDGDRAKISAALEELKNRMKGDDTEAIKAAMDALMKASHKMAEEIYKKAQTAQGAADPQQSAGPQGGAGAQGPSQENPAGGGTGKGKDGAVDADFEVVDDV
jgi:molecular chaperone DnaK